MSARWLQFPPSPSARARWLRWGLVLAFMVAIARFWSPFFGFTAFLQADAVTAARLPATLRDAPVFIHENVGRYDGAYYAQIATDPALRDPDLNVAVDALGYRARRILMSAVAWVAAGGEPVGALQAYAWINLVAWLLLAAILARVLPVAGGWRATVAWCAVLLAGGTLGSVRLALIDLPAATLLAAGLLLVEGGRRGWAVGCLALAGLVRETALLGAGLLWPGARLGRAELTRWSAGVVVAALPLVAWWMYVHFAVEASDAGTANFTLPLAGWLGKWAELWRLSAVESNRGLVLRGWLDCIAITVQAAYLLRYRDAQNAWWRVGIAFVALGALLGPAVWEGLPGAYARVLLPLTLCFNVLAARQRAAIRWMVLGNLSLVSGVWALAELPGAPHQLTDARSGAYQYVVETDARWSVAEWNRSHRWAWCDEAGGVSVRTWPHQPELRVELSVRGVTPRELEVWHAGRVVWSGRISDRPEWIRLPALPTDKGRLTLELRSPTPPIGEGTANTARRIGFACFGARPAQ
jgi:hypothetical protein